MDNFEWRPRARLVAYLEQAIFAITFPTSLVIALVDASNASNGIPATSDRGRKVEEIVADVFGGPDGMLLIILLKEELIVLLIVIGLWATLQLLRATAWQNRDLKGAIKLCLFWRNVNLLFVLFTIIDLLLFQSYFYLVAELILLVCLLLFIFVVHAFMQEVRTVENHIPVSSGFDTI